MIVCTVSFKEISACESLDHIWIVMEEDYSEHQTLARTPCN